ncbi:MAG TPA: OmpH family outer membrane protein [Patescibacteria group bacterium]|jgi:Skp family chaperone for outer membrane proteins|nr:OmpH family outer membrane protein [Patescibacteria group bacterium]
MNRKLCTAVLISSFCFNLHADQTVTTQKQPPITKSMEITNNANFKGKVKVVNGYEVAGNSTKGREIKEQFLAKKNKAEQDLQAGQAELIAANKDFTAKAPTLSDKARRDEEKKLTKLDRDLKEKAQALKEELETDMYLQTEKLGQEFEKIVQAYGRDHDLDLVIDQSSGRPVYVADRLQCTNDIISLMNKADDKKITSGSVAKSNTPIKKTT